VTEIRRTKPFVSTTHGRSGRDIVRLIDGCGASEKSTLYIFRKIKRRTHIVHIVPNVASCLRLVRAFAIETHENWLGATRYLNMDHLKKHKKAALRALAA